MQETIVDSKYKIVSLLGQGGMGAVYEARHLGTGRRVALKVITPSALALGGDMLARFEREARASGAIDSQHVVQVLDTGVDPATASPYLVMEYLNGEDLQQTLRRSGPLPVNAALRIIAQACNGLSRAHDEGIIHRDIKSANLFIARREGGDLTVKILDFGIAKVRADPLGANATHAITRTGALLGSPLYMSPEQVLGSKNIDPRSDVFSLGVTMYEALCGVTPNHDCESVGLLVLAICGGKGMPIRERNPSLPREVMEIVEKALALEPSARFQTTHEMAVAIGALLPQGTTLNPSMFPGTIRDSRVDGAAPSIQRTTPLLSPVPAAPSSPPGPLSGGAVPPAVATTATAFTDTRPTILGRTPRWLFSLFPAVIVVSGALGVGVYRFRAPSALPAGSASPLSLAATANDASPAPSAEPSAAPPSLAVVEADASVTPASASASAPPASAPAPPVAQPVVRPRPMVLPGGNGASGNPTLRPNCDPPYTFNADGKKIWKRDCL